MSMQAKQPAGKEYFVKNHLFLSFVFKKYSKQRFKQKFPRNVKFLISKYFAIDNWLEEQNLKMVEQDGYTLEFVKEQTENICLKAVEKEGFALRFVKEQTEKICLKAVKKHGDVLQFVKKQTENICLKAFEQNGCASKYVKEPTEKIIQKCIMMMLQKTYQQILNQKI